MSRTVITADAVPRSADRPDPGDLEELSKQISIPKVPEAKRSETIATAARSEAPAHSSDAQSSASEILNDAQLEQIKEIFAKQLGAYNPKQEGERIDSKCPL